MQFSPKLLLYFVLLVIEQFRRAEAQIDKISYVMQQRQGQVNADEIVDVPSTFQEYYIDHEWSEKDAREYLRGISHQKINGGFYIDVFEHLSSSKRVLLLIFQRLLQLIAKIALKKYKNIAKVNFYSKITAVVISHIEMVSYFFQFVSEPKVFKDL